jgi:IS1 family transposase
MVSRFQALPDHLHVQLVTSLRDVIMVRLEVVADERWSFVKQKANKPWVWIAMDKQTRQIIPFHIGDRSLDSVKRLWMSLPAVYREQARFYMDQYEVYIGAIKYFICHYNLGEILTGECCESSRQLMFTDTGLIRRVRHRSGAWARRSSESTSSRATPGGHWPRV